MKAQWQAQIREEMAGKVEQATQRVMVESVQVLRKQLEELSITLAALREEDKKSLAAALSTLEERRLADFRRLREDLERVALFTDENFRAAQRQLVHLTSFSQDPEEN